MGKIEGARHQSDLVGQPVFDNVREQLEKAPLEHLFDYSLASTEALPYASQSLLNTYRRDTVLVYGGVGRAMLVAAQLSEFSHESANYPPGTAPHSLWSVRFIVGLPSETSRSEVMRLGATRSSDGSLQMDDGARPSYIRVGEGVTARYQYGQAAEKHGGPLSAKRLAEAIWQLGGFDEEITGPDLWAAAEPCFTEPAASLAEYVALSNFPYADQELEGTYIDRLLPLTNFVPKPQDS